MPLACNAQPPGRGGPPPGGPPRGGLFGFLVGPPRGGPPGGGRFGGGGQWGAETGLTEAAQKFVDRIKEFDKNEDGKIDKKELPQRMHTVLKENDSNGNNALDVDELNVIAKKAFGNHSSGRMQGRREGPHQGGPNHGGPNRGGPPHQGGPEQDGHPQGGPQHGGPHHGGPPSPEQFIQDVMKFDADKDGKLSKAELRKFAEQMGARGPGPGHPQGQNRRGQARPKQGSRDQGRPTRPPIDQ